MSESRNKCYSFEDVLVEELSILEELRDSSEHTEKSGASNPSSTNNQKNNNTAYSKAHSANLTGLAFSGGGIRSATFNLGIIQALAKRTKRHDAEDKFSLLSRFDYLSTVSGGGYIGSWLTAWIHRDAQANKKAANAKFVNDMSSKITSHPCDSVNLSDQNLSWQQSGITDSPANSGFPPLEHAAVRFLRRYSNYLVPRLGLSGDMLALISIVLRNLVLLQLALITMLGTLLLVPYVITAITKTIAVNAHHVVWGMAVPEITLGASLVALLLILSAFGAQIAKVPTSRTAFNARRSSVQPQSGGPAANRLVASVSGESFKIRLLNTILVLICVLACWLIVVSAPLIGSVAPLSSYLLIGVATYTTAWVFGYGAYRLRLKAQDRQSFRKAPRNLLRALIALVVSGAVFGLVSFGCAHILNADWANQPNNLHALITFGPPGLLLAISFIVTIHIGTSGDLFSEMHREWWARIGGFLLLAIVVWCALFALAYYSAPLFRWFGNGGFALIVAWVGASGAGALIANNAANGSGFSFGSILKKLFMMIAPWLFLIGMAMLVSWGLNKTMVELFSTPATWANELTFEIAVDLSAAELDGISYKNAFLALVVTAIAFTFITIGLDINIFSAHAMYRNRLVRAYLGASLVNQRRAHPFTGFDATDDIPLSSLNKQRPLPIVNTTLNMTGGDDLAWQTRRAASFALTPQFVGYSGKNSHGVDVGGYRLTRLFASNLNPDKVPRTEVLAPAETLPKRNRGLSLGTALSISGAAASPNMGYHTSPPVAALLTAFNMRLGYWAGNPSPTPVGENAKHWTSWWRKRPLWSARPILSELSGSATGSSDWVNLTDGGHFDNLGIYELVRRRCRFIVATDAGCDPQHRFEDLANTIRKCWTDFGVHLYFPDLNDVSLTDESDRFATRHGTLGVVEYSDIDQPGKYQYGLILYLKNSLTQDVFNNYVDIRQYASEHESFPHQTTGDQFFDENQFEAYRHLGYCVANQFKAVLWDLFDAETGNLNLDKLETLAKSIREKQASREQSNTA